MNKALGVKAVITLCFIPLGFKTSREDYHRFIFHDKSSALVANPVINLCLTLLYINICHNLQTPDSLHNKTFICDTRHMLFRVFTDIGEPQQKTQSYNNIHNKRWTFADSNS